MQQPSSPDGRLFSGKVPKKLHKNVRAVNTKLKQCATSRTVFVGSKCIPNETSSAMGRVSPAAPSVGFIPTQIQELKAASKSIMITIMFERSLFPSPDDLTVMAMDAVDRAMTYYSGDVRSELINWKASAQGKYHISKLKAELKQVHADFQNVAETSMVSAYSLTLDLSKDKMEMIELCTAEIHHLQLHHRFTDAVVVSSFQLIDLLP
jgi:hypothetical protein